MRWRLSTLMRYRSYRLSLQQTCFNMSPTIYLVTGAARGIGYTLVEQLSARSDTVVYAGVRSLPLSPDSPLAQLIAKLPEVIVPIQINSANEADNAAAAESIKAKAGKVDVLIANAGVYSGIVPIAKLSPSTMRNDFEVNAIGPMVLFNAFSSLLQAAPSPKFIVISTAAACITEPIPFPVNSYGASKAALNFLVKKTDVEYPDITVFPIHPGMVSSDMGLEAAKGFGMSIEEIGAITPSESAKSLLTVIDAAKKDSHGGKFWNYTGEELKW